MLCTLQMGELCAVWLTGQWTCFKNCSLPSPASPTAVTWLLLWLSLAELLPFSERHSSHASDFADTLPFLSPTMPIWQISAHSSNLHFQSFILYKATQLPRQSEFLCPWSFLNSSLPLSVLRLSTLFTYLTHSQSEPCTGKDNIRIPGTARDQVATMKEADFNVNSPPLFCCPNDSYLLLSPQHMTNTIPRTVCTVSLL